VAASRDTYYSLACVSSLAAAAAAADTQQTPDDRRRLADTHAARGVELLGQARAAGYFQTPANRQKLQKAADLDALRDRDDFKKLLRDVEQAAHAPAGSGS
jgi:hypothetical protein